MNAFWILVLLILVSGFFALSEMALASSRKSKLRTMADAGNPKALIALQIMDNPSRLLAATQTGITAAALLMGIYGESALTDTFQRVIDEHAPSLSDWAGVISFTVTIALVTGFSIIFGEIVPKRLAIANPEVVATFCAPFMSVFLKVLGPAIALLSKGSDLVLAFIPFKAAPAVTTIEEIQAYLDEGAKPACWPPKSAI